VTGIKFLTQKESNLPPLFHVLYFVISPSCMHGSCVGESVMC
jgi:hypothetical protein